MDEAEEQRQIIIWPKIRFGSIVQPAEVIAAGDQNSDGDEEFDPVWLHTNQIQHAQRQRKRMPDGKGGNEYQ